MHCGGSVRRSPATHDIEAGSDESAFFYCASRRRQSKTSVPRGRLPGGESRGTNKKTHIGILAISREK